MIPDESPPHRPEIGASSPLLKSANSFACRNARASSVSWLLKIGCARGAAQRRHACFASCSINLFVNCDVTERSLDCPEDFGTHWIVRSPSTMRDAVLRPADSGAGNWISASTRTNYQNQTGGRRVVEAANTSANIRGARLAEPGRAHSIADLIAQARRSCALASCDSCKEHLRECLNPRKGKHAKNKKLSLANEMQSTTAGETVIDSSQRLTNMAMSILRLLTLTSLGTPREAAADEVFDWNVVGFEATAGGGQNNVVISRTMAMMQLAVHDTPNAIERRCEPYLYDIDLPFKFHLSTGMADPAATANAAIAGAARRPGWGHHGVGKPEQRAKALAIIERAYHSGTRHRGRALEVRRCAWEKPPPSPCLLHARPMVRVRRRSTRPGRHLESADSTPILCPRTCRSSTRPWPCGTCHRCSRSGPGGALLSSTQRSLMASLPDLTPAISMTFGVP